MIILFILIGIVCVVYLLSSVYRAVEGFLNALWNVTRGTFRLLFAVCRFVFNLTFRILPRLFKKAVRVSEEGGRYAHSLWIVGNVKFQRAYVESRLKDIQRERDVA